MVRKQKISAVIVTRNRPSELKEAIGSLVNQVNELVVVDNGSEKGVLDGIKNKFKNVKFIASNKNLGGAGGRNLGLKYTKGEYILFMDDDAKAGSSMVKELSLVLTRYSDAGIVQPKIYEKERKNILQGIGHGINLLTGRVYGWGVHESDRGQYEEIREIPMAGCTWMVKREVFKKIGNYDEDFFIPYEDSDFSWRARKAGFRVLYVPKAKVWHQGPKATFVHPWVEWLGITIPERAYRIARNKIIFMRKHAPLPNLLFFLFILVPAYTIAHSAILLAVWRVDILLNYWRGIFSGIRYSINYRT